MMAANDESKEAPNECDYLVVGAGAAGMAFVDTLLTEDPTCRVVLVDRRAKAGVHWVDSYPPSQGPARFSSLALANHNHI